MALSSIMTGALLSANTSRQMAHVQSAVKSRMDGHAGVLDSEIKLDSARGGDTKKKQEELDELQKKASELAETTINTLTTANEDLKKAAKEDQEVQRAEKAAEANASGTTEATDGIHVVATEGTSGGHVSIDVVSEGVMVNNGTVTVTTGNNVDVKA